MKIILDTNVIHKDYTLTGSAILKLSDAAQKLGYEVYIPEIVVDEIFRQYRTELESAYDKYTKGASLLSGLGLKEIKLATGEDYLSKTLEEKKKRYEKRLKDLGIELLPYPKTKHEVLVTKELEGKKPFASSKKGYRDSLIWETVMEQLIPVKDLWGETQVLFLSANTLDFADAGKNLHPDLIKEFTEQGFTENAVELVCDFDKFFTETINAELEELEKTAQTLLLKRKFNRINLNEELNTLLYDEYVLKDVLASDMEKEGVRIPVEYENPTVQDIHLKDVKSVVVHKLTDGSAIIDCEMEAVADIEFYLFKGDYALFDDYNMPEILDWNWNEHYYLAAIQAKVKAKASLRASGGFYRIITKEVHTRELSLLELIKP